MPHAVHNVADAGEICPAGHAVHDVTPAAAYVPAGQGSHSVAALNARCTTHFVSEPVPASVKSVENVNTAPLTSETVRSESKGAASHVCPEAETRRKTSPLEMPEASLLSVTVSAPMSIESSATS